VARPFLFMHIGQSAFNGSCEVCGTDPVRAKMVKKSWNWEWSSAGNHVGKKGEDFLKVRLFRYNSRGMKGLFRSKR